MYSNVLYRASIETCAKPTYLDIWSVYWYLTYSNYTSCINALTFWTWALLERQHEHYLHDDRKSLWELLHQSVGARLLNPMRKMACGRLD